MPYNSSPRAAWLIALWFAQNDDRIAYAAYFDVDGQWPTQIDNNQFPQSQKLFPEAVQALIGIKDFKWTPSGYS